jgi:hypothetical protein
VHAHSHADTCMHLHEVHAFAQTHITYMRLIGAMRYPRALSRMLMLTASFSMQPCRVRINHSRPSYLHAEVDSSQRVT